MLTLFQENALKLHYDPFTIGQTGQLRADLNFRDNNRRLPLGSFSFSVIRPVSEEDDFHVSCRRLGSPLQEAVRRNRIVIPETFKSGVFDGFYADLRNNLPVLKAAVQYDLKTRGIHAKELKLSVGETAPQDFRIDNDLVTRFDITEEMAHRVIERAILASADLHVRFAQMKVCEAISGLTEKDLPILEAKLGSVLSLANPAHEEKQFDRVRTLTGLQAPVFGQARVDAQELLKVRDTDECRAFRDWLSNTGSLSPKEVRDRVRGLNARIRHAMTSTVGKAIRFLITKGLSFAPSPPVGAGASIINTFILERLAPRDAVVAFLSDLYLSVFRKP